MPAPAILPGIRVVAAPSTPDLTLPRMDIAVFAGFAASGPLHLPVAVESVAQFRAVFGGDLALAWDAARGEPVIAHLAAAAAAFFANGGRRCWIVRVARTAVLEALWRGLDPGAVPPDDLAVTNRFPVPGVLAMPADGAGAVPAEAAARAAGSWSDPVRLATALTAAGIEIDTWERMPPRQARLRSDAKLVAGDLLQLGNAPLCYARVDRAAAGTADITVLAAFAPLGSAAPAAGSALIAGVAPAPLPATLSAGAAGARIAFDVPVPAGTQPGQWVRWSASGVGPVWLRADTIDAARSPVDPARFTLAAGGPAWSELAAALPAFLPAQALRLAIDLHAAEGETARSLSGVALTPQHPAAWWLALDDDAYYRAQGEPAERFPLAAAEALSDAPAWLPLGVTGLFGADCGPFPRSATALERDGLSRFDAELFLDPELAELGIDTILAQADQIRFLSDQPRELFGIHAMLGIGNGEATLLAVPDALHTGWKRSADPPSRPAAPPVSPPTENAARFAACAAPVLVPPTLTGPAGPVARGEIFRLQWTEAAPGIAGVLTEAPDPGFTLARALPSGGDRSIDLAADRAGTFFYRVDASAGGVSVTSNTLSVTVRADTWLARGADEYGPAHEAELVRVQHAALRLAAAGGEVFAVLGLPRHARGPDIARLSTALREAVGFAEQRALSFGALYHPWTANGALRPTPPDGPAAGVLAARAARRGAWIAPANEPLRDVVALLPAPEPDALLSGLQASVNMLADAPRGFLVISARTLSDEPGLDAINIRRLLSLLRRLALRQGANYVFEPLGDTLRRSVERGFTQLLSDMFRRGAFAGRSEADSFAVVMGDFTQDDSDNGRLVAELRVAPALPLQFLTLRLLQSGERLSVAEGS